MLDIPPDKFQTQCLNAASYIASTYCSEYSYALEEGLLLAKTELKRRNIAVPAGDAINQEEIDIILQSVRSKTGNAINLFQNDQLQVRVANHFLQQGEVRTFKFCPELTLESACLDRRYHIVARKVIECVFDEYQAVIEGAKLEALRTMYAGRDRSIENTVKLLTSTIHDRCKSFRLHLFEVEGKVERFLATRPLDPQDVESQDVRRPIVSNSLFQHGNSRIIPEKRNQLDDSAIQISKKIRYQEMHDQDHDESSDDGFELLEVNKAISSISQSANTTSAAVHPLLKASTATPSCSSTAQAIPLPDTTALKPALELFRSLLSQSSVNPKEKAQPSLQNPATSSSSSVKESQKVQPASKHTIPASTSPSSVTGFQQLQLTSKQTIPASTSPSSVTGSQLLQLASKTSIPPITASTSVTKFGIDEILEKGVDLTMKMSQDAREGIVVILACFGCAGLVRLLKQGMSSDATQLIVAMINGEDISAQSIKDIHNKGIPKDKLSARMFFFASHSNTGQTTKTISAQETYKTYLTLSSLPRYQSFWKLKYRGVAYTKAVSDFLKMDENQNCEKLCIPVWTLNDAVEQSITSTALALRCRLFNDDKHLVREVAHLLRCALIVICWTIQDKDLDLRLRSMYKQGKPFTGLDDVFPLRIFYTSPGGISTERAEGSTNEDQREPTVESAIDKPSGSVQVQTKASKDSKDDYEENVKLLLGSGVKRILIANEQMQRGTALTTNLHLSGQASFRVYLGSECLQGKNVKEFDLVLFKLIVGSQYQYSTEPTQTGAKLVMHSRNQEHHVLVDPAAAKVIKDILLDREKGRFQ
ncbi:uncharacterized protein FA14DRAFT_184185 [Meira miltonrushii]|uniref:Uncharacterized protein n=1 Tax=Meira miltonrushii TaxID=1280837 RepID=A0A316VEK6_9BASI|nr:uncharacterized protein FA14DRAFT_184185 [Meira miltonrushii]PWN34733.1 hypothetical protein FA14DRAFT_184185 [Meira miltonrushii]